MKIVPGRLRLMISRVTAPLAEPNSTMTFAVANGAIRSREFTQLLESGTTEPISLKLRQYSRKKRNDFLKQSSCFPIT
jgi:hypothetical protein